MTSGDGNGWVTCRCGDRHWGRYGAAGLLLVRRRDPSRAGDHETGGGSEALLQLRATWTHEGGTWALPGGAADSHETPAASALREASEETGLDPDTVTVVAQQVTTDHGDWRYTVVVATPLEPVNPGVANTESDEVAWIDLAEVAALPLHRGLAASWPQLVEVVRALPDPG